MNINKISRSSVPLLPVIVISLFLTYLLMSCDSPDEISELDSRTNALNKSIMCPVCPGESIDQSQNELAGHMRRIVREQLEIGKTDSQIREYFVERYGPVVLLEPSTSGIGLIAWIVPPIGLLVAICSVAFALRVMKKRRGEGLDEDTLSSVDRDRYFKLIEERGFSEDDLPRREN